MITNSLYALLLRGCFSFIFSSLLVFPSKLLPVVIVVHGSFGARQDWWKPGGDFFVALEAEAKTLGHAVVPFCWSGSPTEHEIAAAAGVLAKLVVSYPGQEIILVGHSHGGNVINKATQLLYDPLPELLAQMSSTTIAQILEAAKAQLATQPQLHQKPNLIPISKPHINYLHGLDLVPTLRVDTSYPIEKIYLLGTPVCVEKYHPQMKVVGSLLNLFSGGDLIQPVLGLYQRQYPLHDRITNIEIRFTAEGQKPGHSAMHDQLVGRWLLHIPDGVKKGGAGDIIHLPLL